MMRSACLAMSLLLSVQAQADDPDARGGKVYPDGHGGTVYLPLGDVSFTDQAVSYTPGERGPSGVHAQAAQAVGLPDYTSPSAPGFTSLGCHGSVVLQFTDNVLVDIEGADLYVFEVGPAVEATELAISYDGEHWIEVGKIAGARADVDIAPFIEPGSLFYYVRLTNAGGSCGGRTPGADIDTVAAVGAGYRLSLDSAILFDLGSAVLRPEASPELDRLVEELGRIGGRARLIVEGHTDSTGSLRTNEKLSIARAEAVWSVLSPRLTIDESLVVVRGRGATHPVASNETEQGRAQNRRVDLIVLPVADEE